MPSTVVHAALAGLLACALLGPAFSGRTLALVLGAMVVVDLDVVVGFFLIGAHRAAFHTLVWPAFVVFALVYDTRIAERSRLAARFGPGAIRVAWVTVGAVVLAGIGPDLATNGVNLLYPVHDQFYAFDGTLRLSTHEGLVQTFVDVADPTTNAKGSTEEVQYYTGVDPNPASRGADVGGSEGQPAPERVFPVADSGIQLLLVLTSVVTMTSRLHETRSFTGPGVRDRD